MRLIDWEQSAMITLLEIPVSIDYDLGDRGEISVMGVWLIKEGLVDIEITGYLSPDDMSAAESMVEWELDKQRLAIEEGHAARGDWLRDQRKDIALEMQADALAKGKQQRGVI